MKISRTIFFFFFLLFIFQVVKFSGFTIFEFTNQKKLPFLRKNNSKMFRLPSPCETCAFPFDFVLGRDPKNIFYYQREVENYTDQVPDFLWFDKQEYTNGILRSVILVSIFILRVHETFPLFLRIWLTESILIFREKLFKGTYFLLASNTVRHEFEKWRAICACLGDMSSALA